MIICPHCAHGNREGTLACEACGRSLSSETGSNLPTRKLDGSANDVSARATWGTAHFNENASILIRIRDISEPIVLQPAKQIVLGRGGTDSDFQPDLDLSPFAAVEKGVSRRHVMISRSEQTLTITDLGSANGTHLNGQRLQPNEPRLLRDGDEIRLGQLVAHVYFK
jgi:hypothetical protein